MIQFRKKLALPWCLLFFLFSTSSSAGDSLTLITPEEAAQPDAPTIRTRGIKITRTEWDGPQVNIHSPNLEEPLRIPFLVDITFEASSDKITDFNTLSVKYLKLISIDLTGRIKPYLDNNRLIVKNVKVPQGKHRLQLFIAYISGEKNDDGNCFECGEIEETNNHPCPASSSKVGRNLRPEEWKHYFEIG